MNFSVTTFWEDSIQYVTINKRINNDWYVACYDIISQRKNSPNNFLDNFTNNKNKKKLLMKFIITLIAVVMFGVIFKYFNS